VGTYVFEQSWQHERDRLTALEDLYDANTTARLAALGVDECWRCLEVGCGAGGIALWLSTRVGATGRVVATDLDPRFLVDHDRDNLDVWQHDILTGPLDEGGFDLVHTRAVLEHIPRRREALARLVAAVRPGGWVVVEDVDFGGAMAPALARYCGPAEFGPVYERLVTAVAVLFAKAGADPGLGAQLPGLLAEAGLDQVDGQVHAPLIRGGGARDWPRMTIEHLGPRLVSTGLLDEADLAQGLAAMADPSSHYLPPPMATVWGRRPIGLR
jgi:SAM-dependent methyltransferase